MRVFMKAIATLFLFEIYLLRGNFFALHRKVRRYRVGKEGASPNIVQRVCHAVDLACSWYPKQVLCLQRSATTTCLLRAYGVPAQMVIGGQKLPFRAHAWVEVDGHVVNDSPHISQIYAALDRL